MPDVALEKLRQVTEEHVTKGLQDIKEETPEEEACGTHTEREHSSEFALVSFICGLLGLALPPFSSLAIIFGIAGNIHIHRVGLKGKWMAVTGITLGLVGIVAFFLMLYFGIQTLEVFFTQLSELQAVLN